MRPCESTADETDLASFAVAAPTCTCLRASRRLSLVPQRSETDVVLCPRLAAALSSSSARATCEPSRSFASSQLAVLTFCIPPASATSAWVLSTPSGPASRSSRLATVCASRFSLLRSDALLTASHSQRRRLQHRLRRVLHVPEEAFVGLPDDQRLGAYEHDVRRQDLRHGESPCLCAI